GGTARVPGPRARTDPDSAGRRRLAVILLAGALPAHPAHLALGPLDPAVVELGHLEQVELLDLEVGGQVEVPRRDDGGDLAAEHRRVGGRRAAKDPIVPAPAGRRAVPGGQRRKDREADILEGAPDQARADDLCGQSAAELEGAAPEAPRDEAHREEV